MKFTLLCFIQLLRNGNVVGLTEIEPEDTAEFWVPHLAIAIRQVEARI